MTIRHATIDDLDIITLIETASFHKTEAAKKEEIKDRLELNGDFFWLLDDCGEVLSFVHGLPTNQRCLAYAVVRCYTSVPPLQRIRAARHAAGDRRQQRARS